MFNMSAFAAGAGSGGDEDNGSGAGNNGQLTQRDWGWH